MRAALVESRRADSFTVRRDRERGVRGRAARAALRRRRAETRICRGGREESHTYGTERERATGAPAMTRRSVLQALRQWTRLDPPWWREVCAYYGVTQRHGATSRDVGPAPAWPASRVPGRPVRADVRGDLGARPARDGRADRRILSWPRPVAPVPAG